MGDSGLEGREESEPEPEREGHRYSTSARKQRVGKGEGPKRAADSNSLPSGRHCSSAFGHARTGRV
eukprot:863066-Pleurochrysis_carterae.AAC.1